MAACGRKVRIRVAPSNLASSAAEVAERLNYMPVETGRKDDLAQTCRQCLDRLDPDLRGLLGLNEPVMHFVRKASARCYPGCYPSLEIDPKCMTIEHFSWQI